MRIVIVIFVFSLLRGMLPAQQVYFSNNYELNNAPPSYTGSVIQTSDSGFVAISSNFAQGSLGYSFIRIDKFGDTLFVKNYVYTDRAFSIGACTHSFILCSDGNYIACGSAVDSNNNNDAYVIRFDPNGDTILTVRNGGSGDDFLNSVYEDSNGDYLICGSTSSQGSGSGDFWLVKTSSALIPIWDTVYGTAQNEGAVCGELTIDGGFILSGCAGNNPFVVKVNAIGGLEWQYSNASYNGYGYVSQLLTGEYIVGCAKIISGEADACFIKLNNNGTYNTTYYAGFPGYDDVITSKPIVSGTEIVAAGDSRVASVGYYKGYMVKMSVGGNVLWQRHYVKNAGAHNYFYDIRPTSDGGYIIAGSCMISTSDAWLVKVDSLGCEVAGCDGVGMIGPQSANSVSVYPNPVSDAVTFQFSGDQQPRELVIYDAFGKEAWREETDASSLSISVQGFVEGMYFYSVIEAHASVTNGKLIVAH